MRGERERRKEKRPKVLVESQGLMTTRRRKRRGGDKREGREGDRVLRRAVCSGVYVWFWCEVQALRRAERRRRNEAKDVGVLDFCCCARIGHGWVEEKSAILKEPHAPPKGMIGCPQKNEKENENESLTPLLAFSLSVSLSVCL